MHNMGFAKARLRYSVLNSDEPTVEEEVFYEPAPASPKRKAKVPPPPQRRSEL